MPIAVEHIEELPDIDDRLALPDAGYEIIDGVVRFVPPALEPHAELHLSISVLIGTHVHRDFKVAVDMLTRTSKIDDIAPDVSVYPRARNPETGGRLLEHLAFEIVSEKQPMSVATLKAAKLVGRGVRRVFAIEIKKSRLVEWSRNSWQVLDVNGVIEDATLAVPLSVEALLHAANTDDDVARALIAKNNAIFEAHRASAHESGLERGRAEAVVAILRSRGLECSEVQRARILDERDPERITRWLERVSICTSVDDLLS